MTDREGLLIALCPLFWNFYNLISDNLYILTNCLHNIRRIKRSEWKGWSKHCIVLFNLKFWQFLAENWQSSPSVQIEDDTILEKRFDTIFIYTYSMILSTFMDIERPVSQKGEGSVSQVFKRSTIGFHYSFLFWGLFININIYISKCY